MSDDPSSLVLMQVEKEEELEFAVDSLSRCLTTTPGEQAEAVDTLCQTFNTDLETAIERLGLRSGNSMFRCVLG